ncbi:hypothetical protein T11_14641 [Trichinella zimbabwensis]|uniref:Uncharacterized protein n=1 Tax=Trichinella zimbabwensis TaxID=268475 RepID=A0A0V1GZU6_9BILA|nr:hypothetical protein T11_14641 [Trichinella zimbabwensis]
MEWSCNFEVLFFSIIKLHLPTTNLRPRRIMLELYDKFTPVKIFIYTLKKADVKETFVLSKQQLKNCNIFQLTPSCQRFEIY